MQNIPTVMTPDEVKVTTKETGSLEMTPYSMTNEQFQAALVKENDKRKMIAKYIKENFKKGTDYGPIHIKKECKVYKCEDKYHLSKDCLFKSGAEKFCSLFHLLVRFVKDTDTWVMAGSPAGLFCYEAQVMTESGTLIGFGKGACSTAERNGSANTAIKMAKKRALVDSVITTGGLSDFFTQDLEDPTEKPIKKTFVPKTPSSTTKAPTTPFKPTSCSNCGAIKGMSEKVVKFSMSSFGKPLCYNCQQAGTAKGVVPESKDEYVSDADLDAINNF